MSEDHPEHTEICKLCIKYGTDKGPRSMNGWDYSPTYFKTLEPIRHEVKKVLEVGVCGHRDIPNNVIGASLYVWRDFFPNAEVIGFDNDSRWMVNTDRIHTYCLDAYKSDQLKKVLEHIGGDQFDFIVDDAVHDPVPQMTLLNDLWPYLKKKGWYAMEDVCPYKLPHSDLEHMMRFFPAPYIGSVVSTYKDEKLLLLQKQ